MKYSKKVDTAIISMIVLSMMIVVWGVLSKTIHGETQLFDNTLLWIFYPFVYVTVDSAMGWDWEGIFKRCVEWISGTIKSAYSFIVDIYMFVTWIDYKKVFKVIANTLFSGIKIVYKSLCVVVVYTVRFIVKTCKFSYEWIAFVFEIYDVKNRILMFLSKVRDYIYLLIDTFYDYLYEKGKINKERRRKFLAKIKVLFYKGKVLFYRELECIREKMDEFIKDINSMVFVGIVKE